MGMLLVLGGGNAGEIHLVDGVGVSRVKLAGSSPTMSLTDTDLVITSDTSGVFQKFKVDSSTGDTTILGDTTISKAMHVGQGLTVAGSSNLGSTGSTTTSIYGEIVAM